MGNLKNNNLDIASQLGFTMRHVVKMFERIFLDRNLDITPEQFWIMDMLTQKEESIQADIAEMFNKDKSAIMRYIDVMEEKHWVARMSDRTDRRKKILVVTKQGNEKLEAAKLIIEQAMSTIVGNLKADEIKTFLTVLEKIRMQSEITK